jgi:hypothetical protein
VTNNRAYTWSAAVLETVDATLNRTVSSGEGGHRGCCCNLKCSLHFGVGVQGWMWSQDREGGCAWGTAAVGIGEVTVNRTVSSGECGACTPKLERASGVAEHVGAVWRGVGGPGCSGGFFWGGGWTACNPVSERQGCWWFAALLTDGMLTSALVSALHCQPQVSVVPHTTRAASATLHAAKQATMWQCRAAAISS